MLQYKYEYSTYDSGKHWLFIEFNDYRDPRDIASEKYRSKKENLKQYLPEENFINPFDPTEQELTMFELLYGTDSKDEYLKWMNAVIKHNKEHINEKQS